MDQDDRYKPYMLQVDGKQLLFTDQGSLEQFSSPLHSSHFHSSDSQDERIVDKSGKFPGALIGSSNASHRRVFFFTHEHMRMAIERLVQL